VKFIIVIDIKVASYEEFMGSSSSKREELNSSRKMVCDLESAGDEGGW